VNVRRPGLEAVNSAPSNTKVNNEENHSSAAAMTLWLVQGLYTLKNNCVGRVAQSLKLLTTGWTVRDRILMGDEILRPFRPALVPIQPPVKWVPGLSRGKVRLGRAADHSPPSSAAVMEE